MEFGVQYCDLDHTLINFLKYGGKIEEVCIKETIISQKVLVDANRPISVLLSTLQKIIT